MLRDKFLEAARAYIEEQEGVPALVQSWRTIKAYQHLLTVAVQVATASHTFEVWLVVDLDTEKIMTTA